MAYKTIKHLQTIRKIPDELWDEIRLILPPEKPNKTIGRLVLPFRKVLDGIPYVLRTGSTVEDVTKGIWLWFYYIHVIIDDFFRNGQHLWYSKNYGLGYYYKSMMIT